MLNFKIENLTDTIETFTKLHQDNLDFTLSMTLNALGNDIRLDLNQSLRDELDIKKAKVGNAFAYKKSSKKRLEVLIYSKTKYHQDIVPHHFTGGIGGVIPLEHAEIDLDNMSRHNSIIRGKQQKSLTKAMARKILNPHDNNMFIVKDGEKSYLPPGIYQRSSDNLQIKRIVSFARLAKYNKVLDVQSIVSNTLHTKTRLRFRQSLKRALLTSR